MRLLPLLLLLLLVSVVYSQTHTASGRTGFYKAYAYNPRQWLATDSQSRWQQGWRRRNTCRSHSLQDGRIAHVRVDVCSVHDGDY
jgi:hypothetical protein